MPRLEVIDGKPVYEPNGAVLDDYLADRSHVSVIRGPIGSGTSTASCTKIWTLATEQRPGSDGIRRSRWGIVRDTYPNLKGTTIRTWLDWFPEERFGRMYWDRPPRQVIWLGDVELEVFFLALDSEDDVAKMRSLEVTAWWFNELEYTGKRIFDEAESRTGRFPAQKDGGTAWDGVLADMNAPSEEHWLPQMTGEAPLPDDMSAEERALMVWPKDWAYFIQPPALLERMSPDGLRVQGYDLNPEAENLKWLKPGFYEEKVKGKLKQWIDTRLLNKITMIAAGDPVWPTVKPEVHFAKRPLPFQPGREVIVALDFGRRPCAIVAQEIGDKIQIQREFRMYGVGATLFAPALKRFLEQNYRGARIRFTGDPKGRDRGQADERSAYDIFAAFGMPVTPAPVKNNHLETRLEAVSFALMTSRILVSPECGTLRHALAGKYALKKLADGEAEPIKDKYSDVADTLQYPALYLGEGRRMAGLTPVSEAKPARMMTMRRTLRRVVA